MWIISNKSRVSLVHTAGDSAIFFWPVPEDVPLNDILGRAGGDELIAYERLQQKYCPKEGGTACTTYAKAPAGVSPCLCQYRHLRSVLMTVCAYEELFTAADQGHVRKRWGKMRLSL